MYYIQNEMPFQAFKLDCIKALKFKIQFVSSKNFTIKEISQF